MRHTRFCPAKVNLFLEVTGKRPNGYHELATLFAKINLGDTLSLCVQPATETNLALTLTGPIGAQLRADESNLVCRAARGFLEHFNLTADIQMTLDKQVPTGAGLGGGSSDAANTLLALCEIFGKDKNELLPLAAKLGADVPLFMYDAPFLKGEGIGELLTPVAAGDPLPWLVLVYPNTFISTKEVFGHFQLPAGPEIGANVGRLTNLIDCVQQARPLAKWKPFLFNRLTQYVAPISQPVQTALDDLVKTGAQAVLMSGSGSTVFALAETQAQAQTIADRIRKSGRTVFCTSFYTVKK